MSNSPINTEDSYTTMEDYLRGCVGFDVSDEALVTILFDREISSGTDVSISNKRTRELCKADLYMWCVKTYSVGGSVEDADGGWKHKEGGMQMSDSDKSRLRSMADAIYRKYGEETSGSTIKMKSRGMRVWQRR